MSDVPEGYKMSEVGVIPEEWEVKTLGEIANFYSGGTPSTSNSAYYGGEIAWITSSDLNKKNIFAVEGRITQQGLENSSAKMVEENTLLIALYGATAAVTAITKIKAAINQAVLAIIPQEHDTQYLYYKISSLKTWIINTYTQGGQPNLSGNIVKSIALSTPPHPEQQAIVSALSDVDALITALEQLITKKRNIKQGAMQQLLTGKKRLPGFSGEWEVKKLGDIAEIQRGASPRPIESPIWYDTKSKVGWVRISDVTTSNGKNLSQTKDYLSEKGISQSRFLPKNSLIMSICATVGIPVITSFETCIHDGFIGFSKLNNIDKEFLYYKLKEFENSFRSMGQTGSQSNLNSDLVRNCAIIIPPHPEQQAIAQILTDMDTEIESLKQKRNKYKAIKQGMMQELLSGKTRLAKENKT